MRAAVAVLSFAFATGAPAQSLSDPDLTVNPYLTGLTNPPAYASPRRTKASSSKRAA